MVTVSISPTDNAKRKGLIFFEQNNKSTLFDFDFDSISWQSEFLAYIQLVSLQPYKSSCPWKEGKKCKKN